MFRKLFRILKFNFISLVYEYKVSSMKVTIDEMPNFSHNNKFLLLLFFNIQLPDIAFKFAICQIHYFFNIMFTIFI